MDYSNTNIHMLITLLQVENLGKVTEMNEQGEPVSETGDDDDDP